MKSEVEILKRNKNIEGIFQLALHDPIVFSESAQALQELGDDAVRYLTKQLLHGREKEKHLAGRLLEEISA